MLRFTTSFRETTRDVKLFTTVDSKEKNEKSEFIKDALEFYIEHLEKENKKVQ